MAWSSPNKLFNFRSTLGFVNDLTDETAVLANVYPHTYSFVGQTDTVVAGWTNVTGMLQNDRSATPSGGIEFAGTNGIANTDANNPHSFRVDLPDAGGTYQISIAIGAVTGTQTCFFDIYDGDPATTGVVIAGPFGPISTAVNAFAGTDSVQVTSPAGYYGAGNWVLTTKILTRTFTDTGGTGGTSRLFVRIGDPAKVASGNTVMAHLRIVVGAPPALLMGQICT